MLSRSSIIFSKGWICSTFKLCPYRLLHQSMAEAAATAETSTELSKPEKVSEEETKEGASETTTAQNEAVSTTGEEINPYAYLDRNEFTTEKFKIEINHPKRFGIGQIKKRMFSLDLKPSKVKVIERSKCAFVNFRCEEDREKALEVLQGHVWMGKPMKVKRAKAAADPMLKKRKLEAEGGSAGDTDMPSKQARPNEEPDLSVPIEDRLNDAVTPWWRVSYEEQLERKNQEMQAYIKKLGRVIEQNNILMKPWLVKQRKENAGLCCCLHQVKASPVEKGYRNKGEFTIGKSVDGKDKTVGFRLGQYRSGNLCVVEADHCVNVPQNMVQAVKVMQTYLQQHSTRPALDPETKCGHWMTVTVRTNRQGHLLLMVQLHPQALTQEEIEAEVSQLREYFTQGVGHTESSALGVIALYLLIQSDRHDGPKPICEQIINSQPFEEELLGLKFRISPDAFFQVNTLAAECLYSTVGELCALTPDTTLLDVCCGTGTIGLTMAKRVKQVVGIEMCGEAVRDAKHNAQLNGITNAEFHCGKAEDVLPWLIKKYSGQDVVAVVDPPRAGLHADVVKALRKAQFVRRLVYVSCKPTAAINNLADLTRCQSRRVRGSPYRLLEAIPVDLFPQTPYCELIMLLEREPVKEAETSGSVQSAPADPTLKDETERGEEEDRSKGAGAEDDHMQDVKENSETDTRT